MNMKEINLKIRFDEENGKFGFAIDRTKEIFDDVNMTLKLIAALDILKDREKARIDKTKSFKTEYTNNKDDEFKFWS